MSSVLKSNHISNTHMYDRYLPYIHSLKTRNSHLHAFEWRTTQNRDVNATAQTRQTRGRWLVYCPFQMYDLSPPWAFFSATLNIARKQAGNPSKSQMMQPGITPRHILIHHHCWCSQQTGHTNKCQLELEAPQIRIPSFMCTNGANNYLTELKTLQVTLDLPIGFPLQI